LLRAFTKLGMQSAALDVADEVHARSVLRSSNSEDPKLGSVGRRQIARLRAEGVAVTPRNKVEDFGVIAWSPG